VALDPPPFDREERSVRVMSKSGSDGQNPGTARSPAHIPSPFAVDFNTHRRQRRRFALVLAIMSAGIVAGLILRGADYYLLGSADRFTHPQDRFLRPSGLWGHGIGVAATFIMMLNFLYPVRKRARWMAPFGSVPMWLVFHVSIGLMTPVVILFHAAFRFSNLVATFTYGSLVVVVLTGLTGRFIYALVPGSDGLRTGEMEELRRDWQTLRQELQAELGDYPIPDWLEEVMSPPAATSENSRGRTLAALLRWPTSTLQFRGAARALAGRLRPEQGHALRSTVSRALRLRFQIEFYSGVKRLLTSWRFGHSLLAYFLVAVILAHVAISLAFGYHWIF
jgi:dihydropyrimidine dehydrogenase (NAD+) subunit PreT